MGIESGLMPIERPLIEFFFISCCPEPDQSVSHSKTDCVKDCEPRTADPHCKPACLLLISLVNLCHVIMSSPAEMSRYPGLSTP